MDFRRSQIARSIAYLASMNKMLRDVSGIFLLKGWKQKDQENIVLIDENMIPEILRIQSEAFRNKHEAEIIRYSKRFRKTFYVIKNQKKVVGYCIHYLKPIISSKGFKKQSVIFSIATDRNFRGKGFGKKLLKESIEEMKLNRVSSILLYVNANNIPAIRLYEKTGFVITDKIENICGHKEKCYKMELKLTLFISCIMLQKALFSIHDDLIIPVT